MSLLRANAAALGMRSAVASRPARRSVLARAEGETPKPAEINYGGKSFTEAEFEAAKVRLAPRLGPPGLGNWGLSGSVPMRERVYTAILPY
jgi:hypothetical protein